LPLNKACVLFTYKTISIQNQIETKEKSSKFIACIFPIQNEQDAKANIDELWKQDNKATHVCYAYRLGFDKNNYRANDDGEPNGTAGKPILGQIDSNELTNVLIAVVRYYGGTKLGVSGLIQAYKEAAFEVISISKIEEKDIVEVYQIEFPTIAYNDMMAFLKKYKAIVMQQNFDNECLLIISLNKKDKDSFFSAINDLYHVNLKITPIE
jgi:uncharacterized YigZ family protein